jgi:TonB family protein
MTIAGGWRALAAFLPLGLSLVGCALDRPVKPTADVAVDRDPPACRKQAEPSDVPRGFGLFVRPATSWHDSGSLLGVPKLQADLPAPVDALAPAVVPTREEYWAELRTLIQARMVYPEEARRRRQTGTVALTFEVAKAGYVRCITLDRSSGIGVLDRAAIELVLGTVLPRIPEGLGDGLPFRSNFHYRLDPLDTPFR